MIQFRPYLLPLDCGTSKRIQWVSHFELPDIWLFAAEYVLTNILVCAGQCFKVQIENLVSMLMVHLFPVDMVFDL
uniref:Uncharacterized protein n=1 Tax=Arundo donax TaxID=35708 RepID=A0A0A9E767_ARUDO